MHPLGDDYFPQSLTHTPRPRKRILDLLRKGSTASVASAMKSWSLDFCQSPVSFNPASSGSQHLGSLTVERTEVDSQDPDAKARATGELSKLTASLAFRSIGYKSEALPGFNHLGIPFDTRRGLIPNIGGRVVVNTGGLKHPTEDVNIMPGVYCTGWVQRGPTGVIATTMTEAFDNADSIVEDWQLRRPFMQLDKHDVVSGWAAIKGAALRNGCRPVSWADWKRIDAVERERGRLVGKPRLKFTKVEDMLAVLD